MFPYPRHGRDLSGRGIRKVKVSITPESQDPDIFIVSPLKNTIDYGQSMDYEEVTSHLNMGKVMYEYLSTDMATRLKILDVEQVTSIAM